jgi:hypothetical protein
MSNHLPVERQVTLLQAKLSFENKTLQAKPFPLFHLQMQCFNQQPPFSVKSFISKEIRTQQTHKVQRKPSIFYKSSSPIPKKMDGCTFANGNAML